jgi:hypothetical protein
VLTPDFANKVIYSDSSITDIIGFHGELRSIEASDSGMMYPTIHIYKQVDLGGGALFPAIEFVNGWSLQFPAGNYLISGGNLKATINPVAGCYVMQTQSAAYAVTVAGESGVMDYTQQLDRIENMTNLIPAVL